MNKNVMKHLDLLCAVFFALLYVFPLVLGNNPYEDDLFRDMYGMSGAWLGDGRPFTFILMMLLSGHFLLCDVAPFYLLASSVLLAYSGILLARRLLPGDEKWVGRVCISTVMIISPFFLQNLSYQYDVLSMSIAQFLAVYVALKITDFTMKNFLVKLGLIFILFGLYQPSLNTYMALSLILSMETMPSIKKGNINFLIDVGIAGIVSLIYLAIIHHVSFLHDTYSDLHRHLVSFNKDGFVNVLSNVKGYMSFIKDCIRDGSLFYMFIGIIWSLFGHILNAHLCCKGKIENIIYAIYPFMLPLFLSGPLILLQSPVCQPRTCVAFCSILLFVFYTLYKNNSLYNNYRKMIALTLFSILPFVFIMYSYGNALTQHIRYERNLSNEIMVKLRANGFQENKKVFLLGYGMEPNTVSQANINHPIFTHLMKKTLDTKNGFTPYIFRQTEYLTENDIKYTNFKFSLYDEDIQDCLKYAKVNKPYYLDYLYALYRNQNTYCVVLNHDKQSIKSDNMGWLDKVLNHNQIHGDRRRPSDWIP